MRQKKKLGIIDDHNQVRSCFSEIINRYSGYSVVIEASNGKAFTDQFKQLVPSEQPEIVLTDINMPEMDGFATVAWLHSFAPTVKVVVLTVNLSEWTVIKMINLGVAAYLNKIMDAQDLLAAINAIETQGSFYPNWLEKETNINKGDVALSAWNSLTDQQREITRHLCSELKYHDIAYRTGLSMAALDMHAKFLFRAFSVSTRIALAILVHVNQFLTDLK